MKKLVCCVVILLLAVTAAACSGSALPEGFDEAATEEAAKSVVTLLESRDYDGVEALCREDLRGALSAEALKAAIAPTLEAAGSFESYKTVATAGTADRTTGEEYAVVVLVCGYKQTTITYTLSFDSRLELVGFYFK